MISNNHHINDEEITMKKWTPLQLISYKWILNPKARKESKPPKFLRLTFKTDWQYIHPQFSAVEICFFKKKKKKLKKKMLY